MASSVTLEGGRIAVRSPYVLRDALRLAGGTWVPALSAWCFDPTPHNAALAVATVANARVDPAVRALLADEYPAPPDDLPEIPGLGGRPSWPTQRAAYLAATGRPGYLLHGAMGAGKTRVAIGLLGDIPGPHLVICPKSVVENWPREFTKHAPGRWDVAALTGGSVRDKRDEAMRALHRGGDRAVVVLNYDAARMEPFAAWSLRQRWGYVVADEAHRAKSPGGVTSRYLARLRHSARRRLALTGTPMPHGPLDIWAQYRFLDPDVLGDSFVRFRLRYAIMGGYREHEVIGYRDVGDLHRRIYSRAYRFPVGVELPEAVDLPPREFELGVEARDIYKGLEADLVAAVGASPDAIAAGLVTGQVTAANAMVLGLRLAQLTGGHATLDDGRVVRVDESKAGALRDFLEDLPDDEPVVVWCRFRPDLDAVHEVALSLKRPSRELSGRRNDLAAWQAGEGVVLATQIDAGGVGVDLTRARYAVYYSVGFNLGNYWQSRERLHRPGQTRGVIYCHLVARNTIDPAVYRALQRKEDTVTALLAGLSS